MPILEDKVDGEEMALRYQDYISQQGQTFPGAEDLLAKLVERGYQLYGATNGVTAIQQGRLKQSAITPYFKEIFISEQLGTQKPEVAFYEKISNLIPGFAKEQALMIGDSLTADIAGGNAAGVDTVWYNPDHKENSSPAVPTMLFLTINNYWLSLSKSSFKLDLGLVFCYYG